MISHLSFFELIIRGIPEGILFVFAVHIFSNTKIKFKNYVVSSILLTITIFLIRMLPISYGIHTILNIIMLVVITSVVLKISIIDSIRSGILTAILMFICEGINMGLIQLINGNEIEKIFSNPILKTVYGLPSLIIFTIIILLYKFIKSNRKGIKSV